MIIAITGGTGYIGKKLVENLLKTNHEIRLLSRKPIMKNDRINFFLGDLTNPEHDLSKFLNGVDILYHCAGELKNEHLMHDLHINGTKKLIRNAKGNISLWVQLSSVGAYGNHRFGTISEKSEEKPYGVYENTKTISDSLVINSNIPYVIVRPSNVFSKDMHNQSLIQMISMIKKGLFFFIGKKGSIVNYIHVDKVVDVLINCSLNKNAVGEVFIVSESTSVEKMIFSFMEALDRDNYLMRMPESFVRLTAFLFSFYPYFPLKKSRIDALTSRHTYNSNKIKNLLSLEFKTSIEEDFKSLIKEK
ncbi:NAD-dependent epimerase/dehydratase family protein [Pseudothioglobus sp. nBUS_23]|uniref:NAD-dependent epimerase/dehydratase family protein n=1 Tax=Pseudothioglobus sp. nBUS_23 TaxID=3395318 RepID=UPI003EBE1C11